MAKINTIMKKMWFFGDSWCYSSGPDTWTKLLADNNGCMISHLGTSGMSLQGMLLDFLNNVEYIQQDDIVVFVFTSIYRWRFKDSCFRYSVWDKDTMNGIHQHITDEQMNAYAKYVMHLSEKHEEELRGACYINYMLNYDLPCKAIYIPAFGDIPIKYLPNFKPVAENYYTDNTYNLTRLMWDFEKQNGFKKGEVQHSSYAYNHCGEPGTNTDAHPLVFELAQKLLNK